MAIKFDELDVQYTEIKELQERVEKLKTLKDLVQGKNNDIYITIGGNKDKFPVQASGLFGLVNAKLQQDEADLNQKLNKITIK